MGNSTDDGVSMSETWASLLEVEIFKERRLSEDLANDAGGIACNPVSLCTGTEYRQILNIPYPMDPMATKAVM